ncbi:MAG: MoxR family ATPase [Chloroherpetonaceae bacterium]|nr:MoxR family ATPase [Chloroherpetonaceae bacterium]
MNHSIDSEESVKSLLIKFSALQEEIGKVIVGQKTTIEELLCTLAAGGHCLLEGVPGLAKTLMIRTLADAVALSFRRIQFTPDLMPSDIVGTEVLEEDHTTGKRFFKFNKGAIFANIVLADEINRTPPKTQAALLEAMQESSVTQAGTTYKLDRPFFVLATQNPIEQAGTYPLPEAQLDRFLLFIRIGYPSESEEIDILAGTTGSKKSKVAQVISGEELLQIQALVRDVHISREMIEYIAKIVRSTRPASTRIDDVSNWVSWGAGPRAGQSLVLASKALALLRGRFSVTMNDIHQMAFPVLRHRVIVNFKAEAEGITSDKVTAALLEKIDKPKSPLA